MFSLPYKTCSACKTEKSQSQLVPHNGEQENFFVNNLTVDYGEWLEMVMKRSGSIVWREKACRDIPVCLARWLRCEHSADGVGVVVSYG